MKRLSVMMLIASVLGFTEASLMHHHALRAATPAPLTIEANADQAPMSGPAVNVGHVCALCVVGSQGSDAPVPTRWIPFSPTSCPPADPPSVIALATTTGSISKRGPPAA